MKFYQRLLLGWFLNKNNLAPSTFYCTYLRVFKQIFVFFCPKWRLWSVFLKTVFFKSAGSISQTIFIQSTWNFAHFFFINLSSTIRKFFWYHKNCLIYDQFLTIILLWKIRTSTLNLHKFFNIQYFYNLIGILSDWFIMKKEIFLKHEWLQLCCQPRSTLNSEALQPSSCNSHYLEKKIAYKFCFLT